MTVPTHRDLLKRSGRDLPQARLLTSPVMLGQALIPSVASLENICIGSAQKFSWVFLLTAYGKIRRNFFANRIIVPPSVGSEG